MNATRTRNRHRHGEPHLIAAAEPARLQAPLEPPLTLDEVAALGARIRANVRIGVHLPESVLDVVVAALLAGGHLLVEDHPGVGKTQLARTLASSLGSSFSRVQATVDLLPADIVGASIWRAETASFEFRPGPVFAHVVLVDELNRATPKTQSGLLEAMQEGQVTVDGDTRSLPDPFMVIATQNPSAGYDGTYPLPPAQLDRFLARVSLGYPTAEQERALLSGGQSQVSSVSSPAQVLAAQQAVARVHTAEALLGYVVALVAATREHALIEVGASPRAGLLLLAAARARAAVQGREFVVPDDVQAMARAVLQHRLQPVAAAGLGAADQVITDVLARVPAR
ncbi:MAG: MoxR-like ATPase [Solirubrobacteraceae bacterium]|jgi:MoxR-like ATPase|nr:MoxR-like ATPase [Solirubrobacteraceae bacterium]